MAIISPEEIQDFLLNLDKEITELTELKKSNQSSSFSDSNSSKEIIQIMNSDSQNNEQSFGNNSNERNTGDVLQGKSMLEDSNEWCEKSLLQLETTMNLLKDSIENDLLDLEKHQQILDSCQLQISKIKNHL